MLIDHDVDSVFSQTLSCLVKAFRQIEDAVPPPALLSVQGDAAFRYQEKSLEQALVQKLARVVSGLGAARVLLEHGYTQELATLQRTLDEFGEDIVFLGLPLLGEERTELHDRYLAAFYEEEFNEDGDPLASPQRRPMILRRKIRAAIARAEHAPTNPSFHSEILRTINKLYSGYVHGASPQIMDMFGGKPPHFHVSGMLGTPRIPSATYGLWNCFCRAINWTMAVALALQLYPLSDELMRLRATFEKQSGWKPAENLG